MFYDIVFYHEKDFPEYKLNWLKAKYPKAKAIQVDKEFNYVIYAKRLMSQVNTKMFWLIPADIGMTNDMQHFAIPAWDESYVHHQLLKYSNLFLIPKDYTFTDDEFEKNFFNNVKFIDFGVFYTKLYDVFFLSYKEKNADANFKHLLTKYPHARHVQNIKGIFNAHLCAAVASSTDFFWVVDADAEIAEDFNFDYEVPGWDFDVVHIWQSKNKVNDLVYGNGGVKLIPRHLILQASRDSIDVTTSIGANIKIMEQISNYNNFDTSPFASWRAAFRECAKLASAVIDRQVQLETDKRLATWCTRGKKTTYGPYVVAGAIAGRKFGLDNKQSPDGLRKINDWAWLESRFNQYLLSLKQVEIQKQ
jgi:hypothetical protein